MLISKTFPMFSTKSGKSTQVIHHYIPNRRRPIITEHICNGNIKHTFKELQNGQAIEVFENNGIIYKVLKDFMGNPMVVRKVNKGKKRTFRFFANEVYDNLKLKFKDLTEGFIDIR